ncbi:MAG TPA: response regulator [Chthoniobacteraceae bacterium]|nr:response regulator [Chthoniobacteraceae bacterium]
MQTLSATASTKTSAFGKKHILLLDDDVELADSLKHLIESSSIVVSAESSSALSAAGFPLADTRKFVVTTAGNGTDGLREMKDADFDVIICDLEMPKMAGDTFYLAVKKSKPHLCDRFLFVTGHSTNPKYEEFLKKTGRIVLIKPVPIDELVSTIAFVIKQTSAA